MRHESEHEPTDADDRPVELDEPDQPDPPIDDADRDNEEAGSSELDELAEQPLAPTDDEPA